MSYISAQKIKDQVVIWERTPEGRRTIRKNAPYYLYVENAGGEFTSLHGEELSKIEVRTHTEFTALRNKCSELNIKTFESDIPPELKLLSADYYNKPAPALNVTFYDIEVDYDKERGFSSVADPYAPINAVAFYHKWLNKYVVLAVPPTTEPDIKAGPAPKEFMEKMHEIASFPEDIELEITFCRNERELLQLFLTEIADSDIICGWNSDFFDTPYIGKRLSYMGNRFLKRLSFPEAKNPEFRTVEIMNRKQETLDIHGRVSLDYMVLFKKYEMAERPSYKLESISEEILSDNETGESTLPKLEYKGTLADLYVKDFAWFIRYNIRDTEILKGFEDVLGYVELANEMCHMSTGLFTHVSGTLKLAELATINFCHHELDNIIVNDMDIPEDGGNIKGAFVLMPQVGEHAMIGSIDITSLYPRSIMAINISPETLIGQFVGDIHAHKAIVDRSDNMLLLQMDDGQEMEMTGAEWRSELAKRKWAVSGYGTVFSQEEAGIIPTVLSDWFSKRKHFQKLKGEAKAKASAILKKYEENAVAEEPRGAGGSDLDEYDGFGNYAN